MKKYSLARLCTTFIFLLKATICFFSLYTFLAIFLIIPLIFLIIPYRSIVFLIFATYYNNKYKLDSSKDGIYAAWTKTGNVSNISFFLFVDAPIDVEKLRERVKGNILRRDKSGCRPYGKLLKVFLEKFKLLCLTDASENMDFNHHIRLCPGADDTSKVYNEQEFFEVVAKHLDMEWPEVHPKWEILVTPKVKIEGNDKTGSVIFLKFHHFYMDGISLIQFMRNCIYDQPAAKLSIDPVNPPIPTVPFVFKILMVLTSFWFEPYFIVRNFWNVNNYFLSDNSSRSGKILGRLKLGIPRETMRTIRKSHNCTTQAVLHSAFLGSLEKIAKRKGIEIPSQTLAAALCAKLPYPNEFPINLAYIGHQIVKTGYNDPIQRLKEMNRFIRELQTRQFALKSTLILDKILALYPMPMLRLFVRGFKVSYFISNVPGSYGKYSLQGINIGNMNGIPPLCNGIGFCAGAGYLGTNLGVAFLVNKSPIISNREDMNRWILEFENEIRYLKKIMKQNSKNN